MSTKGLVRLTTSWWCPNERDFSGVNVKLPAESSVASATLTRLPRLKLRSTTELPGLAPWISPVMVPEGPEADGELQPIQALAAAQQAAANMKRERAWVMSRR